MYFTIVQIIFHFLLDPILVTYKIEYHLTQVLGDACSLANYIIVYEESQIFIILCVLCFQRQPFRLSFIFRLNPYLFILLFRFYGPFKNISLLSSRSFIKGGRKPENPEKNYLTIRKQNLTFPHMTRAICEKPNGLRVNSPIH